MEPHCAGGIFYFAIDGNHPVIVRHRATGGKAVFVRDNQVVVAEGEREEVVLSLDRVPLDAAAARSPSKWKTPWPPWPPPWR